MGPMELLHVLGKKVEDGGHAGRDLDVALIYFGSPQPKLFVEVLQLLDQGARHLVQELPFMRELYFRSATDEQRHCQFALQALNLLRDSRLAQMHPLGRFRHTAGSSGITETPELLESVLLVTVSGGIRLHSGPSNPAKSG
jgi:hypothetical protein